MNRHIFVSLIFLTRLFIVYFWCFYSNTYVCPRKCRPVTLPATFLANWLTGLKTKSEFSGVPNLLIQCCCYSCRFFQLLIYNFFVEALLCVIFLGNWSVSCVWWLCWFMLFPGAPAGGATHHLQLCSQTSQQSPGETEAVSGKTTRSWPGL